MKFGFVKQFLCSVVLTLSFVGLTNAQSVEIDFGDSSTTPTTTTGDSINRQLVSNVRENPLVITVPESAEPEALAEALVITISDPTSIDPNAQLFNTSSTFGIFSNGGQGRNWFQTGNEFRFDADRGESINISFNQDVFFENVDFEGFSGSDTFAFGSVTINEGDLGNGLDIFDFTTDGSDGLFLSADTKILLTPTGAGSEVGIQRIQVSVVAAAVPEPSSIALLGLLGIGVVARRRR